MSNGFDIYGNSNNIGKADIFGGASQSFLSDATPQTWSMETAFDKGNIGTTLGAIGQGIGLIAGIYGANEDRKMKNKLYDLEKKRVDRNEAKEDKFHADMQKAWG